MQNMSRVPPPGTGTYSLPNGYYNNSTSAVPAGGQVMTASAASNGLQPVSRGLPTTTLAAEAPRDAAVQTAQFTAATNPQPKVQSQSQFSTSADVSTAQFTSSSPNDFTSDEYQSGNYTTVELNSSPAPGTSDAPEEFPGPELQWQP